ncbi:GlyGly-CTERM sorting domain-containing protein [Vibrio sp. ER1A]|nr:GlyGly-CTERM sorting domain-containing protein [Vibrio sp. ER1A]
MNVTTSAPTDGKSNSRGSGSSGGGSFGPFGLLALLLVGIYRRIRK